jgi:hypothetical protein
MTNPAYRAMKRGKASDKSPEEVWEEVQETTMQLDWDVENMVYVDDESDDRKSGGE